MSKFLDELGLSYVWSKIKSQVTAQNNLSNNYATSALENEQLLLLRGDSFELAFSKLEKAILDNEEITSVSLNNLNTRISERNLQDYFDNLDGSIELFKVDCAGSVMLPTWSKLTSLPAYNITSGDIATWNRGFRSYHFATTTGLEISLKNDANQNINFIITSADPQGAVSHGSPTLLIPTLEFLDYQLSSYINAGSYDSTNKKILLKHGNTTISSIDATAFIIDPSAYVKHANTSLSTHTFDWDLTTGDITVEDKTVHVGGDILTVANGLTITLSVTSSNTYPMYVLNSDKTEILASGENGTVTYANHTGSSQLIYAAIDNNDRTTTYNTEILTTGYDDEVEYLENTIGTKVNAITVEENELVTSAALNDLNSRINNLNTEKLNVLISGTDIKTINNQSILGSGNIDITSDLGDSLVSMFSKLDEITPVRTIEFDVAATTGQIIYSRDNVTEDALLSNVTDTLIYSIEVSGNSNSNIYDLYKVYVHFQPCALRSPITFIEHICKNPASSASLYGLKLLTYYYPKAVNNGYPWICYLTASSTDSRHVKIRVYQDSSNVDWKDPAIPVAVTAGLYNTTYLTKGSEMTITSTGWITNGITQASSTTATISTSLPKNFVGSIYQAGEALTGGNLVYRALNDGKIYRVGTLTATINDVSTNLILDPMFGVSRIVNSRAINVNITASDLDYKRSINPSTPNNGSSFQIETGWTKGDTMYYKCTLSGSSLIPTGHITTTLTPGYAYFPIGVINSASSLDFDCIGHEFITLNASGKVTHVNGLEIAGGSGGGSSQDLSDYVKYSNTISNTDPNGSCSSSETIEDNTIYTSGSTHYLINPGYTISLDVLSDDYTTYIINNTSPKAILASGIGDIEWTNTTSSNIDVLIGSGTSGLYYIATIYLKGYTEEVGEIKEKLESINGVLVLPLSVAVMFVALSVEDDFVYLDEVDLPSNYILRIATQLDNILSFYHQNINPLYILLMNDLDFDNPVPHTVSSCLYLGNNDFCISWSTTTISFEKNGLLWLIIKTKETYNKVCINGSNDNIYAPDTSGIINLPLKTINNQQIFGSGNILATNNTPLLEKTYENYTCEAANIDKGHIYFMNIVPTSDNYYEPWYIRYTLEIQGATLQCLGYYDITIGSAGTTSQYRVFNRIYSSSYYPSYYHLMAWHNSAAKYSNREDHPIKVGEGIYRAYKANTMARTYVIKVLEMHKCEVSFPTEIETYDSFYSDANYGHNTTWNATSNGVLDNYDANTLPYTYYEYYTQYSIHSNETPVYRWKICGFDSDNRLIPITITNRTNITQNTLTPCKVPMVVSRGLIWYNTTTALESIDNKSGHGVIYRGAEASIEWTRYNFNGLPGLSKLIYLLGNYDPTTDKFTLDDDYYVFVPDDVISTSYNDYFITGKYYWYIGRTSSTTLNYGGFNLNKPLYYFNGTDLLPEITNKQEKLISGTNIKTINGQSILSNGDITIPSLNNNLFIVGQGITSLNSATGSLVNELNDLSQAGDNTFPTSTAVYNAIVAAINATKVTIYSGSSTPSNSSGSNGDLYLQTS